jgi:hypothetical protein
MPADPPVDMPADPPVDMPVDPPVDMPVDPPVDMPVDPPVDVPVDPPADGPPAGAYEACSGDPLPSLGLTEVLGDLDNPIHAVWANGDNTTAYVVERGGRLLRANLDDGSTTELLEIDVTSSSECGFLSAALHPNFDGAGEKRVYLSYNPTCGSTGSSVLSEYTIEGDTAMLSQSLMVADQPESNHNGGCLGFGPDGYLYYSLGDGGGGDDQHGQNGNGQNVNVPLGSILRFDVDNPDTPPPGNLSADDVGGVSVDSRIFHYGLRNPWRFGFDRLTGDLYIGDVGQNTWEEVSFAPAGTGPLNFGWSSREGFEECPGCNHSLLEGTTATDPIHAYSTATGGSAGGGGGGFFKGSITGGFVYRGTIPGLYGRYIYADYVVGEIRALTYDGNGGACDEEPELIQNSNIPGESLASFAQDGNGEVYVLNLTRGTISRIDAE